MLNSVVNELAGYILNRSGLGQWRHAVPSVLHVQYSRSAYICGGILVPHDVVCLRGSSLYSLYTSSA